MTHGIYKVKEDVVRYWDEIDYENDLALVLECDSYEEAVAAYEEGGYDSDLYCVI